MAVSHTSARESHTARWLTSLQRFVRARTPSDWLLLTLSLLASTPIWAVEFPPLQDMPFHASTIRVLHSMQDPQFGFAEHYVSTLERTQYVLYYLFGGALSYGMSPLLANKVLASCYLSGTPLALAWLTHSLGRDRRVALLSIPLLYNVMFGFGLLPFLLGIPFMVLALAAMARHCERPSVGGGVWLGVLAICAFYSHMFPFAVFGVGCVLLFPWGKPARWWSIVWPFLPLAAFVLRFLFMTEAGELVRGAITQDDPVQPLRQALSELWNWTGSIFRDQSDERHWIAWAMVVGVAALWPAARRERERGALLLLLPVLCMLTYFTTPGQRGMVWLFSQRFPILALFTLVPFLRMPRGAFGVVVLIASTLVSASSIRNVVWQYQRCERDEVGDLRQAIEQIPMRSRVVGLMYDRGSRYVEWAPYLHMGSYEHALRGGLYQFTFASHPHWPFTHRPGANSDAVAKPRLNWEWAPHQVSVEQELAPNYEYLLVRGSMKQAPGPYELQWSGDRWSVWRRKAAAAPSP